MRIGLLLLSMITLGPQVPASDSEARFDDRELELYLQSIRGQLDAPDRSIEDRAQLALDVAERIDEAAQVEPSAEERAERWDRAVRLLDTFNTANPSNPLILTFELQAGVYRWAEGRTWMSMLDRSPADPEARRRAIEALEDAIARLRPVADRLTANQSNAPVAQNVRFRLALAMADLANLEDDPGRSLDARQQAIVLLRSPITDPALAGHVALLNARLRIALDDLEQAEAALKRAGEHPGPSEADRLDVRIALELARKRFDQAKAAIEESTLDPAEKDLRAVRVLARQWIDLFPGRQRSEVEAEAFDRARRLREAGHPEATPALAALAAMIQEPDDPTDPGRYELLAEGHLARGDWDRAIRLNRQGADRAEAMGQDGRAWLLRFRAGAILFRAGDLSQSVAALSPVAEAARNPNSPALDEHRASASLLHALALGRLASAPGAGPDARAAYESALKAHLDAFPDDPTAAEARWTLGQLLASRNRTDEAVELWAAVPPGHPRALDARLAAARAFGEDIADLQAEGQLDEAREVLDHARDVLSTFLEELTKPADRNALELALAELEMIPEVGDPEAAATMLDRLVRTEVNADRRDQARRWRAVATAMSGRYVEAEQAVRSEFDRSPPAALVDMAARLDRAAAVEPSDMDRRRLGSLVRMLTEKALTTSTELDTATLTKARVLRIQGQVETGDLQGARASVETWNLDPKQLSPDLLGRLADALDRLGLYPRAIEANRALLPYRTPGTRPWMEARYALAVAYYRTGRSDDARRLIDGTAALHPDLGGADLQEKFYRLRRRLPSS